MTTKPTLTKTTTATDRLTMISPAMPDSLSDAGLCVYKGPHAVRNYFDPDVAPPTPLVEIPDCLNPLRRHGVRIFAKMMTMHPANNVKAIPATLLLARAVEPGKTKTIVEYSSGSTALSMSLLARAVHGITDMRAFLSNKTSGPKLRLMQLFGIDITLFGGPSQPAPMDERGGIRAASRSAAGSESVANPDQYGSEENWKSHARWTAPQLLRQLPEMNVICAGMGTSGTMSGLGTYFKEAKPSIFRLGVCTAAGQRVPGPRSYALLEPVVNFPWRTAVDRIEEVGEHDAFRLSLDLIRQGLVCGPSSGFNLHGLLQFLEKRKAEGTLDALAGPDGEINCVFICCDLPYQYVDQYFKVLDATYFPDIKNEELLSVDLHRYDEAWELDRNALSCDHATVIDLRQPSDFARSGLPGSVNIPLVQRSTSSPFRDPAVLRHLWQRLEETFKDPTQPLIRGKRVLVVCYDGDSSRVATSVLRAKGCEADSLRGGLGPREPAEDECRQAVAAPAQLALST